MTDQPITLHTLRRENLQLKITIETLRKLATKDELTGIDNRRGFKENLIREIAETQRNQGKIILIMFDIDYFKKVNDTFGHLWGDKILRSLCQAVSGLKRDTDIFARTGGEEFFLIFPEQKDTEISGFSMQRYQKEIAKINRSPKNDDEPLTISLGALIIDFTDANIRSIYPPLLVDRLLKDVDTNLYHSKENGRNRLTISTFDLESK